MPKLLFLGGTPGVFWHWNAFGDILLHIKT